MDEKEEFDFSELPPETQDWLLRLAARSGEPLEVVIQNCTEIVHDMARYELDPNAPRVLNRDVLKGIRLALASIDPQMALLPVIDRILKTAPLPPQPGDDDRVPCYRVNLPEEDAAGVYAYLMKVVLAKGANAPFGKFPVRVLLAFWKQTALGPLS